MQAVPAAEPVIASTFPTIIPGPFILLLAIPAIPLLLFSIGARPPDTSNLPFSTDDLWQTTALISIAGAVVLCLAFWPGAFSSIGNWVTDGAVEGGGFAQRWTGLGSSPAIRPVGEGVRYQGARNGPARRYSSAPKQAQVGVDPRRRSGSLIPMRQPDVRYDRSRLPLLSSDTRSFRSLATKHLAYLREGSLAPWYTSSEPDTAVALMSTVVLSVSLYLVMHKIIGDGHKAKIKEDRPPSSSRSGSSQDSGPDWIDRQVRKRAEEKDDPQATEKRVGEEKKVWEAKLKKMAEADRGKAMKDRRNDEQRLLDQLRKKGLPIVGLDSVGVKKSRTEKREEKKAEKVEKKKEKEENGESRSFGSKVKRAFLGRQLADSLEKRKAEKDAESGSAGVVRTVQTTEVKGGPGWKAADDAVAQAAIEGGAMRAEALASRMNAEKARS